MKSCAKMSPSGRALKFVGVVVVAQVSAPGIEQNGSSVDDADVRSSASAICCLQFARQPDVVLIEKGQPLSGGLADGAVPGFA